MMYLARGEMWYFMVRRGKHWRERVMCVFGCRIRVRRDNECLGF